jgi:hypothetical protein
MRSCPRHAQSSSLHDLPRWVALEPGFRRALNPPCGEPRVRPTLADRPKAKPAVPHEPTEVDACLVRAGQNFVRASQVPTDCPKAGHPSSPACLASQAAQQTEVSCACSASAFTAFGPPNDVFPRLRSRCLSDRRGFTSSAAQARLPICVCPAQHQQAGVRARRVWRCWCGCPKASSEVAFGSRGPEGPLSSNTFRYHPVPAQPIDPD